MAYTIAFFGTKPYDESSFNDKNKEFGFEILLIIPTIAGWDLAGSKSPISKISPLDF